MLPVDLMALPVDFAACALLNLARSAALALHHALE